MGCIFTEINGGPLPYEGINTLAELTREMLVNRRTPSIPPHVAEPLQARPRDLLTLNPKGTKVSLSNYFFVCPLLFEVVIAACYSFDARFRPSARQVRDIFLTCLFLKAFHQSKKRRRSLFCFLLLS